MKFGYIIASNEVARDRKRVGYLYREAPDNEHDSGWRVFSGEEGQGYNLNADNFALYDVSTILSIDSSIEELLDAPAPVAFERNDSGTFVELEDDF